MSKINFIYKRKVWLATSVALVVLFFFFRSAGMFQYVFHSKQVQKTAPPVLDSTELKMQYQLDTFFQNKIKYAALNACVLVSWHGKIIYENANGWQNYEKKIPLSLTSTFNLASTSKPLTATAVLQLYENGLIKLTDSLTKYFPKFPYKTITIQDLLSHRSGLPDYTESSYFNTLAPKPGKKYYTNQDVFDFIVTTHPALYNSPNRAFDYCNTNYCLLALLIEKVSGEKFSEYMLENVFFPANMIHTYVSDRLNDTIHANETYSYLTSTWNKTDILPADGVVGDKGTFSTVEDLFAFDRALANETLLKKETQQLAYTGYSNEKVGVKNYGLGWRLIDNGGAYDLIYHNGWWRGYTNAFCRRQFDNVCVAILCNKYNKSAWSYGGVFDLIDNGKYNGNTNTGQ